MCSILGEKSGKRISLYFYCRLQRIFDKRSNSYRFKIFGRNNTNAAGIMVDIDRIQDTLNQSIQNNEIYFKKVLGILNTEVLCINW